MSVPPTAQEALSALDALGGAYGDEPCERVYIATAALDVVKAFIESAAAEADAWAKLEAWRLKDQHRKEYVLEADIHGALAGKPFQCFLNLPGGIQRNFGGDTRLAALQLAAAWCEKEGA